MPSQMVGSRLDMPVPHAAPAKVTASPAARPAATQPSSRPTAPTTAAVPHFLLSPLSVINLTFNHNPGIRERYHNFQAEEARYDFFYTSRDSLTVGTRLDSTFAGERDREHKQRDRHHVAEVFVEKLFFNTSRLDVSSGYRFSEEQWSGVRSSHPFVKGSLRYPLWTSRVALQRASEEIVRQNDLNDAQLEYLQTVRLNLQESFNFFYGAIQMAARIELIRLWLEDLHLLRDELGGIKDGGASSDLERVEAEIATAEARYREVQGRLEIEIDAIKAAVGLPFDATVEILDEPFNPFADASREELLRLSIATDPEIATLKNAVSNAQVQLDLARRGKWDAALVFSGECQFEGARAEQGTSEWYLSAGIELSAIDDRVTGSLEREALADIERFHQAVRNRENEIHVETLGSLISLKTAMINIEELSSNLDRYVRDYTTGLAEYRSGGLNIDDLLVRRENLFKQQREVVWSRSSLGHQVARLCSSTGKFFDLINRWNNDQTEPPVTGPAMPEH